MTKSVKWSKEKVLTEIHAIHKSNKLLNPAAVIREHPYHKKLICAAIYYFGSWRKAVEAAGFDYDRFLLERRWTKEKIISEIQAFHKARGTLQSTVVLQSYSELYSASRSYFGSWRKAVKAAGFDYSRFLLERKWTKEKIISQIQAFYGARGTLRCVRKENKKLQDAACKHFGSWRKVIEAAGFDYDRFFLRHRWTKKKVISEILAFHKARGTLQSTVVLQSYRELYAASRSYFGSWRKAIEAAGFDYDRFFYRHRWTKEKIISEIQAFYKIKKTLKYREILRHNTSLLGIARVYFGSWRKAVETAGFDYDQFLRKK